MDVKKCERVPRRAISVQLLGFSGTVKEYMTLSPFAIFEPYIWRRLMPFPACLNDDSPFIMIQMEPFFKILISKCLIESSECCVVPF